MQRKREREREHQSSCSARFGAMYFWIILVNSDDNCVANCKIYVPSSF